MRVLPLMGLLSLAVALAVACGASDDKKVAPAVGGEAAGEAPGGTGGTQPSAGEAPGGAASGAASGAAGEHAGASSLGGAGEGGTGPAPSGAGAGGAGGAAAACEAAPATLADKLEGHWLICGAVASNARIWHALLTFASCSGPTLTGTFHWLTTNSGTSEGNTLFNGSFDAETGTITLEEYEVTGGNVVTATDTFKYDPDSDTLTDGAWTCGCSPGTWTVATRVSAGTDVDACP